MKKKNLFITGLFIVFFIGCKPLICGCEPPLIHNLVLTDNSKDYTGENDGRNITFKDSVPFGTTQVSIKYIEVSFSSTPDKQIGDKLNVGTPNTITVTKDDGDSGKFTVTIYALKE